MYTDPNGLYEATVQRQHEIVDQAAREHLAHLAAPRPWLDPAIWSAVAGPVAAVAFLAYFAREILAAVGG